MLEKITLRPKLSVFLAGIVSTFALPPFFQFWLLFFCLGILGFLLNKAQSKKQAFIIGYCFGFGFFSAGLSWISHALALDLVHFGWLIPIALAAGGAFFGLFIAIPALIACFFLGYIARCIAFASCWAFFEWIRSFFLTGFPWNLLGSSLAFDHGLLQPAATIGSYGLSALTILIAMFPCYGLFAPQKRHAIIGFTSSLALIAALITYGQYRTAKLDDNTNSDISIRIVQPSIPQNLKWDFAELEKNFADYIELSQADGFEQKKIVIWGETASTFPVSMDRAHFYQMLPAVPQNGYLITGSIDYMLDNDDSWLPINAGLIFKHGSGIIDTYAKSHLVPFGEYIPFRHFLPKSLRPITKVISDFQAGEGVKTFAPEGLPPFGMLICYEIIFPHEVADNLNRPKWLINLTNDGWYGKTTGPYQHLASAQLRAVEEGLTIVRAANSGVSAIISRTGKILHTLELHQRGNLDAFLPEKLDTLTPYAKSGNLYFFIMTLLLIVSSLIISVIDSKK